MFALYARLIRPVAILLGRQPWLPKLNKFIVSIDRVIQRLTRGHVGMVRLAGLPGLTLTVAGAKSGIQRSVPLLCIPYGDSWLIAGTNWGAPKPPAWIANVAKASEASVNFEGRVVPVAPRELEGPELATAWATMLQTWPNYDVYAARVSRPIRVFLLEPAA